MTRPKASPYVALLIFVGLSLIMRFFSFFPSVINHDESTYILIASELLEGSVYWRDVIDTKPIGIFLLFAIFQFAFGKSILIIRLLAAIWVALSAWMLYLSHKQLIKVDAEDDYGPIASGVIFIFLTSIFTFYGVSPNTELFFCLFSITALYISLKYSGIFWMFLAGLLLGIGFMIKYVVLFDAIAIGLFYLWQKASQGRSWTYWLPRSILMGVGFIIPFIVCGLFYYRLGMLEEFNYYTFELSGKYLADTSLQKQFIFVIDFFLRFLPVTIWFIYASWKRKDTGNVIPAFSWVWGLLVMFIILLPGKQFGHYTIQFMLPFSLLAGSFFDSRQKIHKTLSWMRSPSIGYPILIVFIIVNLIFQKKDYFDKRDFPREIAEWLNTRLSADDVLYVGDYQQIIYALTDKRSPTPYMHSTLIWSKAHNYALQIDSAEEWRKILKQNPRFILIHRAQGLRLPFLAAMQDDYHLTHTFENDVKVYERN